MTESEGKNSVLSVLSGKGLIVLSELHGHESFIDNYNLYQEALIVDGYIKAYIKRSALITSTSIYLRLTREGERFLEKGGYQ